MDPITHFAGEYDFLSNFYDAEVVYDGMTYPTTEHAYQAAKVLDKDYRIKIRNASTAGKAKKLGQKKAMDKAGITIRKDWENIKIDVMWALLWEKFSKHWDMKQRLLATGDAELVEGNWWHDYFWGVCDGKGKNHLGRLLMKVRAELKG